jgi:hypothetical protein
VHEEIVRVLLKQVLIEHESIIRAGEQYQSGRTVSEQENNIRAGEQYQSGRTVSKLENSIKARNY